MADNHIDAADVAANAIINANVNLWQGNALKDALVRLGLTDIAAREFMENGVTDVHRLRSLDDGVQKKKYYSWFAVSLPWQFFGPIAPNAPAGRNLTIFVIN